MIWVNPPPPAPTRECTAKVQTYCTENSKQIFPEMKRILFAACIGEHVPALHRVEMLREGKGGAFVTVSADEKGGKGEWKDPDKTTAKTEDSLCILRQI